MYLTLKKGLINMALKDKLKKWLEDADVGPERKRLAERIVKDADDEESAGLLNRLLDGIEKNEGR
jgi:hypothetical protein